MEINIKEYLEKSVKEEYKDLCEHWKTLRGFLAEIKVEEEKAREKLLNSSGGPRMEFGVKIQDVSVKGSIKYKDIPEVQALDENYIEAYRGESTVTTRVTVY